MAQRHGQLLCTRGCRHIDGDGLRRGIIAPVGGYLTIDGDRQRLLLEQEQQLIGTLGDHAVKSPLAGSDDNGGGQARALLADGGGGVGTRGVFLCVAGILIELGAAAGSRCQLQQQLLRGTLQVLHLRVAHDDGSGLDKVGNLLLGVAVGQDAATADQPVATHVVPLSLWQPRAAESHAVSLGGGDDGSDEDVVAKHILTLLPVGLVLLGPLIVERPADADARVVSLACGGVDVGHELIAQVDAGQQLLEVGHHPDAPLVAPLVGAVGAEDGREDAKLHPAQQQLRVGGGCNLQVSAQVVSPVAEAHVSGGGGEIGLEGQRAKGTIGIA